MMGASNRIPEDALRYFADKRVRIFPHNDKAGSDAGKLWAWQLIAAGVKADGFSFAGLMRADGLPVDDLNDFAHVHPDQWEAEREAIEDLFLCGRKPAGGRSGRTTYRSGRDRSAIGAREYAYETYPLQEGHPIYGRNNLGLIRQKQSAPLSVKSTAVTTRRHAKSKKLLRN
jgi:hypothetical protein